MLLSETYFAPPEMKMRRYLCENIPRIASLMDVFPGMEKIGVATSPIRIFVPTDPFA